ncbi:MAG: hypothetical protein U5N85_05820 [Arcicella sp.]|nr:hypothetical protein [Arcicella sp.]
MVENPDEFIYSRANGMHLWGDLAGNYQGNEAKAWLLFDLPVIKFEVVEHQITSCNCPNCGKLVVAEFPPHITAPVQYGNRTKAFWVLLNNKCQVSFRKIGVVFESIAGQSINQTTLQNANNEAYLALESVEQNNIRRFEKCPSGQSR